jgi:hypothetical protein
MQSDRDGVCKASRVIEAPTNQRIRKTHEQKVYGTERDLHVDSVDEAVVQLAVLLPGLLHDRHVLGDEALMIL